MSLIFHWNMHFTGSTPKWLSAESIPTTLTCKSGYIWLSFIRFKVLIAWTWIYQGYILHIFLVWEVYNLLLALCVLVLWLLGWVTQVPGTSILCCFGLGKMTKLLHHSTIFLPTVVSVFGVFIAFPTLLMVAVVQKLCH